MSVIEPGVVDRIIKYRMAPYYGFDVSPIRVEGDAWVIEVRPIKVLQEFDPRMVEIAICGVHEQDVYIGSVLNLLKCKMDTASCILSSKTER